MEQAVVLRLLKCYKTQTHVFRRCCLISGIQYNDQRHSLYVCRLAQNQECIRLSSLSSPMFVLLVYPIFRDASVFVFTAQVEHSSVIIFSVLLFTVRISLCIICILIFNTVTIQRCSFVLNPAWTGCTTGCAVHRWDVTSAQTHSIKL